MMLRLLIISSLVSQICFGQSYSFSSIDGKVKNIDAPTPDSLAKLITASYKTELEKTRAIFSWIAQHIAYNTGYFNIGKKYAAVKFVPDPFDTASSWKSGIELTAERVLRRRVAVCDGYAKLFKTLCDYAGLKSEIILGYAKCHTERSGKFRTNHTWNAVMIDSSWYLLDVTWASGYIDHSDNFIHHLDETYFLSPPRRFILDHYPEELKWTLMENPPTLKEFTFTPFRYKSFVKYSIHSFSPSNGIIEAAVGDTIHIELKIADLERDQLIAPDPSFDSTMVEESPASVFLKPLPAEEKIVYTYVVGTDVQWLHLIYNHDPVLRYKLNIRNEKPLY